VLPSATPHAKTRSMPRHVCLRILSSASSGYCDGHTNSTYFQLQDSLSITITINIIIPNQNVGRSRCQARGLLVHILSERKGGCRHGGISRSRSPRCIRVGSHVLHLWLIQCLTESHAYSLLQAGCSKVFISSRKAKACEEACDALNKLPGIKGKAISIPADISKVTEVERLAAEVGKHTDHVDILFANAGATWGAPFDKHPAEAFAKVMDLNVNSVFYCIQK
jgi:hypothetical protein